MFQLADSLALSDLAMFVGRANRLDAAGAVRLLGFEHGLSAWASPLYPTRLGEQTPTVLGVHSVAAQGAAEFDITMPSATLGDVLSGALADYQAGVPGEEIAIELPEVQTFSAGLTAVWTAVTPPRHGWEAKGALNGGSISAVLSRSTDEIAEWFTGHNLAGQAMVDQARASVWSRPEPELGGLPGAAALALDGLGFMQGATEASVWQNRAWWRLSTPVGDVLIRPAAR